MTAQHRNAPLDLSADVTGFFRGLVDDAIQKSGYQASDAAETYVVGLLADYARPEQLSDQTLNRPLTLLLEDALQAVGIERFERLRSLGDGVLYVSGFFGDHFETRGVELGYVASLGASAYQHAAAMLRTNSTNEGVPDVFLELSNRFEMYVELLSDVAGKLLVSSANSNKGLVKVYERWLKTGSKSLAETLTARGMVPLRGTGSVH